VVAPSELTELARWTEDPTTVDALWTAIGEVWREAGRRMASSSAASGGVLRTRVVNFVAYSNSNGVCERASSVLTHLAGTHPSRALLLLAEPQNPAPSIGASLQAFCHTDAGTAHRLCFDHIFLTIRGQAAERLPGIVTRLLLPDLPSILWWPGDPPLESRTFVGLSSACDVVIVDSSEFAGPMTGLCTLARLARPGRGKARVADLNWDRLTEWREIVAQFFDSIPLRRHLQHIQSVEISFAADPYREGVSAQALLFSGWLASRLGWKALSPFSGSAIRYQSGNQITEVRFGARPFEQAKAGSLVALSLESELDGQPGRFSASFAGDMQLGRAEVALGDSNAVARHFSLDSRSERTLLAEEIEAIGADCALEDALDAVEAVQALPPR
jgi:glucose-6-phosphate dehydrogenase assembly protein OpcA